MSDVAVPKVGKLDKRVVIGLAVAGAAFVGWRFYTSGAGTGGEEVPAEESDFELGGEVPSVIGAVQPGNAYGRGDDTPAATTDDYGFTGTTNAQWSQYVATNLSQSDTWSYTQIVEALGQFLAGNPLTSLQQRIVQAGIAVGGYAPVGSHVVVSGGDTPITVAPSGLRVAEVGTSTVTVTFSPVAGAQHYQGYRNGVTGNVASSQGTSMTFSGLTPNTSYTFTVAAESASHKRGPKSGGITARTKPVTLTAPRKPAVSSIGKETARVSTGKVAGATGYNWYVNNIAHGHSDGPTYTLTGLKSKTRYRVTVAADTSTQAAGKQSAATSFKTK